MNLLVTMSSTSEITSYISKKLRPGQFLFVEEFFVFGRILVDRYKITTEISKIAELLEDGDYSFREIDISYDEKTRILRTYYPDLVNLDKPRLGFSVYNISQPEDAKFLHGVFVKKQKRS